ncbi:hypothetical protein M0R19_01155 [Candidatus Pacearchaeota archaeon]|nr:hypothetical protein [Candidatus Pacearchaeota archaeon]
MSKIFKKNNHHKKIHKFLKKHHPQAVKKAKKIFSFKYPKLVLLIILIALAYYIFTKPFMSEFMQLFNKLGIFGTFISGILITFGFTAPFAIGLLIKTNIQNIFLASLIGGIGATIGDLFIFSTIKLSFMDEFKRLEKTKAINKIKKIVKNNKHILIKHYLLYIFAGIIIASPLPDEIGVSMLAGLTTIDKKRLAITSFLLHTSAIFFILYFL